MGADDPQREAWLAARGIGSSDIPRLVFGYYGGPWAVAGEALGVLKRKPPTLRMKFGTLMEPVICQLFNEEGPGVQAELAPKNTTHAHPKYPHHTASPDMWTIEADRKIIEGKTAENYRSDDWGPSETDANVYGGEACRYAYWQHQWQQWVTETDGGYIATTIGVGELRWYSVRRDEQVITTARAWADWAWDLIQRGEMPPVDDSDACMAMLNQREQRDELLELDGRESGGKPASWWVEQGWAAREMAKVAKPQRIEADNHLRHLLGGARHGRCGEVKITHTSRGGVLLKEK